MTPKTRPTRTPEAARGWSRATPATGPGEGLTLGHPRCGCNLPVQWTAAGLVLVWRGKEKHLGGSITAALAALNRMKCPACGKLPRRKRRPVQAGLFGATGGAA